MKLYAFVLLALAISATEGRRLKNRKYAPTPEGPCDLVQAFDPYYIYTYKYVVETRHYDTEEMKGSSVRINCTATITVPQKCSAKMRVSDCSVEETVLGVDGRPSYRLLDQSQSFNDDMSIYETAFQFNGGQITNIYVDKQERTNITNFKRGILSSLQAFSPLVPRQSAIGDVFEIPQVNIYGQGKVQHKILKKLFGLPATIEVVRDASKIELPWERKQWNFLRMQNNRANPLVAAIKDYVTLKNDELWAKPKQTCVYELARGRQIVSGDCYEHYPLNPTHPLFDKQNTFETNPLRTVIHQKIDSTGSRRMNARDRSLWNITRFDEDNLMFEEEWEETHSMFENRFDAPAAFMSLIRNNADEKTPALISKLARWMTISSQENIEAVWTKCDRECDKLQKERGRILWAELLNNCVSNDWCEIPYCSTKNLTSCEKALETFVWTSAEKSPKLKSQCLEALGNVYAPSEKMVGVTLKICRAEEHETPECVKTLGTLVRNFYDTCDDDCLQKKTIENAKSFLEKQLKRSCRSNREDQQTEDVMMTALGAIGRLGRRGNYALDTVFSCAMNAEATSRVQIKALIAYGNITNENIDQANIRRIVQLFGKADAPLEVRVTCFHLMMKKNLSESDLRTVYETIMRLDQHDLLAKHCKNDIRVQMMLRGTQFSQFYPRVADMWVDILLERRLDVGLSTEVLENKPVEKSYEMDQEITIPVLNMETNCSIKFDFVYESKTSMIPVVVKLTVGAKVEGQMIKVIEAAMDVAGLKQVIDRIFGQEMVYAKLLNKLLKTPVGEFGQYTQHYPAMEAITTEGKYAYVMDVFAVRSPFAVKVFGYDVGLESLLSFDIIKKITLEKWMDLLQAMKEGIVQDIFYVGQPFVMQHATPTSIGSPMLSTIDFTYLFKNKLNLKADILQLFWSTNERGTIEIAPELHITGSISRVLLRQFTKYSGTEVQVRMGHNSGTSCVLDKTHHGVEMSCTPKEGTSKVFYMSALRKLIGDVTRPREIRCNDYQLRDLYRARKCKKDWTASGFIFEFTMEHEVDAEYHVYFEKTANPEARGEPLMKTWVAKVIAKNRSKPRARNDLWSSSLSVVPARNEIQLDVESIWFSWKGLASARMPQTGSLRGLHLSFNFSKFDNKDLKYWNFINVKPITEKKYVLEGEFKRIKSDRSFAGFTVSGLYNEAVEGAKTDRVFHLDFQDMASSRSPRSLFGISFETTKKSKSGVPGYENKFLVQGTILPMFEKYVFEMAAYDNKMKFDQVMRMSAHYHDSSENPIFFIHKLSGNFKQPNQQAYTGKYYCIGNLFQCEYTAVADNNGNLNTQGKLNVAKRSIRLDQIIPSSQTDLFSYNVKFVPAEPKVYHWQYITDLTQGRDRRHYLVVDYPSWDLSVGKYVQVQGTVKFIKHSYCSYCHTFEIKHPQISFTSISKRNQVFHEEKWLEIHYSIFDYVPLPVIVKHYVISSLENGLLQLGYKMVFSTAQSEQHQDVAIVKYGFFRNIIDCRRMVSHGYDVQNMTCLVDLPLVNTYFNLQSYAEGLADGPNINMNSKLEIRYSGMKVYGNSVVSKASAQNYKWITKGAYGRMNNMEKATEFDINITLRKNGQTYDITGQWETVYKTTGVTKVSRIIGSSHRNAGLRDLEINVMCDETSDRICNKLKLNKEFWIEYERRSEGEHFDRFVVTNTNGRYAFTVDIYEASLFGLNKFSISWERGPRYVFEVVSPLLNASYLYDTQNGLKMSYAVITPIYSYSFLASVDGNTMMYDYMYDTRKLGGKRLTSSASLNYKILRWEEKFAGDFMFGLSPESFGFKLKIPDFNFAWERTYDLTEPTPYRKLIDFSYVPRKLTVNKFVWVLFDRSFEIKNTVVAVSFNEDGRFGSFDITNINVNLEPECLESKPTVITGNVKITRTAALFKISDPDRFFVCDIDIDSLNPLKQHIEFNWHFMGAKMELMWDFNKLPTKFISMACKATISTKCWKTKTMTPIIDLDISNKVMATEQPNNFPTITMSWKFAHALPIWFIPSENLMTLDTAHTTDLTTMTYFVKFNKRTYTESHLSLNGCYSEYILLEGYKICWPNTIQLRTTSDIPYLLHYVHVMDVHRDSRGEWMWSNTFNITSPMTGFSTSTATTSMAVRVIQWKGTRHGVALPSKIELKEISAYIPSVFDRWLMGWYRPYNYQYNDIVLENGRGLILHTWTDEYRTVNLEGVLLRRGSSVEIPVMMKSKFTANSVFFNATIIPPQGRMSHSLEASYVPNTRGWMYKQILDMPRWYVRFQVAASSPLSISTLEWEMRKPEGLLRKFELSIATGNLRCEYNLYLFKELGDIKHTLIRDSSTRKWTMENSATFPSFTLTNSMVINGIYIESMDLNLSNGGRIRQIKLHWADWEVIMIVNVGPLTSTITKRGRVVDFNMNWENRPYLTQTVHLTYDTDETPNYVAVHDTVYYQCTFKFAAKQMRVQGQLLDCTMKNSQGGLRVEYVRDDNGISCNVLIKTNDNKRISCRSTSMRVPEMEADLSCYIVEGSRNEKFTTLRVTMQDFPFMDEKMTRDKVLFLSRFVDLWMKASRYSEKEFGEYFQTNLRCTRKEICYDLARRFKVVEGACVKEMRRILGPKFVYLSDPALLEYTVYKVISQFPGSIQLLPQRDEWDDKSVTVNMNKMIEGKQWKLFKWSFAPWVDGTAGIQMLDKDDIRIVTEFKSSKFHWLNYKLSIGSDLYEGCRILNFTNSYLGWKYNVILGLVKGKFYPIVEQYCTKDCSEGIVTEYNWSLEGDRNKISAIFVRKNRLGMDMEREHLIGELSIPALTQIASREQISMDSILHEVLRMQHQRYRNKVTAHVNKMVSQVATSITKTLPIGKSSMLTANIAQYAFATGFYEASKYGSVEDIYASLRKYATDLVNFEFRFSELAENLWEFLTSVAGGQLNSETYGIPLRKMLQGDLGMAYRMEGDVFVLRYHHSLERYPGLTLMTETRLSQPARNTLVMITKFTTTYFSVTFETRLVGKQFYVEKVNLRVVGMNRDIAEIRFVPDPMYPERSVVELYFSDNENNYYGCRGVPTRNSPLIHVHCFETDGGVLPPNPLSSKLMSYWDIYVDVVPLWSSRAVSEFFNAVMSLKRGMSICRQNAKYIDNVLLEVYHVTDLTIRKRLVTTITDTCRHWTRNDVPMQTISESPERLEEEVYEQELGYETFPSQYKYAAYDTLQKYVIKEFVTPSVYAMKIVDIEFFDFMFKSFIDYSAPVIHNGVSTLRFLEPVGYQVIERCANCPTKDMEIFITSLLKSPKLSVLNHEFEFGIPKRGNEMKLKMSNDWMWFTADFDKTGRRMTPIKCVLGLMRNTRRGVEVLFFPELPSGERPTMSFLFYVDNSKYCCDATVQNITLTKMACKQFESDRRGANVATCKFTPMKTLNMGWNLFMESCRKQPSFERIGNEIDEVCEVTNPTFKTGLSRNIVSILRYMTEWFRLTIKETLKVVTDILEFAGASMWKAFIDLYDFWKRLLPEINETIKLMKIETFFDFWVNLSNAMQRFITIVYKSGYVVNEFFYELPVHIRYVLEKFQWKYSGKNLDYIAIVASKMLRSDKCTFGIVSTLQMENIMSLNGHYYEIPRNKMEKCPYDLAADVVTNTFSVLHVNEDIVINLPGLSFTVDRDMKIFNLTKQKSKIPMSLPMYHGDVSCVAMKNMIYCDSPYLDVMFHADNNKRMAVFVKVAVTHCSKTRGMAGIGGKSDVPEMPLPSGEQAGSMEDFVNAYSTDKSCRVDTIQVTPVTPNRHCEAIFTSPELIRSCPNLRASFMKTCNVASPTSPEEACKYAKLFVWQCNAEGRPTMIPRTCETCKGSTSTSRRIEKVIYTVVMSLSRSYDSANLQDILNTVRRLAVSHQHNYEVNFVTYGGDGRMYGPAFYFNNGRSLLPTTLPWTLPTMRRNGPPAEIEPFYNALWFTMMNVGYQSTSSGVGRVFLLASPESLDYTALSASTCVNRMRENLIETYLLVPETCNNARSRTRAPYGVRRLFDTESRDVCTSSLDEIASAMDYHNLGNMANCQCDLENPYTGQTKQTCHAERPRA